MIKSNTCRKIWRYAQADFDSASLLLSSLDLNTVLDPININISWNHWKSFFLDVKERYVHTALLPK